MISAFFLNMRSGLKPLSVSLLVLACIPALSYAQQDFAKALEDLKPEIKKTLKGNIERHWMLKTEQSMRQSGFSEKDIAKVIQGPSFIYFIEKVLNDPKTEAGLDHYLNQTLNEKNLLAHIQQQELRRQQENAQVQQETLRLVAQIRKEQNLEKKPLPWYQKLFHVFNDVD